MAVCVVSGDTEFLSPGVYFHIYGKTLVLYSLNAYLVTSIEQFQLNFLF